MPSTSKIKGSGFEREVAKFLTEHYGENFIRNNSGSGAYVGGANRYRKQNLTEAQIRHAKGDIVPPEGFPLFNAECKFYADFGFHQLLESSGQLEDWLNQLMDAADPGDLNILFFKINRRGKYVAVQVTHDWTKDCSYNYYQSSKHGGWMIYTFENFFKLNSGKLRQHSGITQV